MIGESQRSKLSTRVISSNSLRATSAGAGSVTAQPPTSSSEDLKQDIEDDKSQQSIPPSENDGDKTPINMENESSVPKDDDRADEEAEDKNSTSSNRQDEENTGNCIEIVSYLDSNCWKFSQCLSLKLKTLEIVYIIYNFHQLIISTSALRLPFVCFP